MGIPNKWCCEFFFIFKCLFGRATVENDTPVKTIVKRRETRVDNGFLGVTISTNSLPNWHYYTSYVFTSFNLQENF